MIDSTTITIPAARGARHKARRLARANPGTRVDVLDKRGTIHYSAYGLRTQPRVKTSAYHWSRRSIVHNLVQRTWNYA